MNFADMGVEPKRSDTAEDIKHDFHFCEIPDWAEQIHGARNPSPGGLWVQRAAE